MKKLGRLWLLLVAFVTCLSLPTFFRSGISGCLFKSVSGSEPSVVSSQTQEILFYVSPVGNDVWSGKLNHPNAQHTDGPFRTLTRARDAIRQLKSSGPLNYPVTVYIRGGVYRLNGPMVFTSKDSGTRAAPITYSAYPGEVPVLSGGQKISGWTRYTGMALASPARDHLWVARVPGVEQGEWCFREFFVNGQRRTRARTPNTGFFHVDGKITPGKQAQFKFHDGDIHPAWAEQGHVEIVVLQAWAELRMYIRHVDEASRTVTLSGTPAPSNHEANARYWIENTLGALDAPGEWYLDRKAGLVYYYPMRGEDMSRVRVIAARLRQLIRFEGDAAKGKFVNNIRLRGLTLAYTDWSLPGSGYADLQAAYDVPAAVYGSAAHSCALEQCLFTHLGGYAIEFGHGSKDNRISRNEMTDLGAGGVKIGDPKIPAEIIEETGGNIVADNHIHDIGKVYPAAVGIWVGQSGGNMIAHNEINNTFYTAISVGWTWGYGATAARRNVIEFNNLHDIGRGMLSDMGCIYTLGVQPGTVERNNLCHDVSRYKYGGWGIYTDEGSSDILIEDNIVYRTEDGSFHQHYGKANVVRNNIFALGENAQIRRSKEEPHLSFTFERNIVYWKDGILLYGKWDDNHYRFDHNLYYSVAGQPIEFSTWSFEDWQKRGQDVHSLLGDPLFADPERGDFSLDPASPAFRIGFTPIDLSQVGPRK